MYFVNDEFDTVAGYRLSERYSNLSMDGRFNPDQQANFLNCSDSVMKQVDRIANREFERGLNQLRKSNATLSSANSKLDEAINDLRKMNAALENTDRLIKNLSEFLRIVAGAFI
jgi:hypothetical protein